MQPKGQRVSHRVYLPAGGTGGLEAKRALVAMRALIPVWVLPRQPQALWGGGDVGTDVLRFYCC